FANDGARIDGEEIVTVQTSVNEDVSQRPYLMALSGEEFVLSWDGNLTGDADGPDNSGYAAHMRIFGDAANYVGLTLPVLGHFAVYEFATADVASGPQLFDQYVSLSDPDSADLAGGYLELIYVNADGGADDALSIRSVGNGAGEISVLGMAVFYEGVQIGIIDASADGSAGANLRVDLLAAATPAALEALIEALGYELLNGAAGNFTKAMQLKLYDGDGFIPAQTDFTLSVQDSPSHPALALDMLETALSPSDTELEAGPVLLAPLVVLRDFAGLSFDTGMITLAYSYGKTDYTNRPYGHTETLTVVTTGSGATEITLDLDGVSVLYGGVKIAELGTGSTGGQNGENLT
ncbi:MAG: hypothetical protein ACPGVJ_12730, partial [Mangrovicoccus sp.]